MSKFDNPLNNIKIASPCSADWNRMYGDEKVRFCGDCKLNVYNLSGMSNAEAQDLVQKTEGRLCVRYFQRADGSVITQDCPVGWRAVKKRVSNLAAAACTLMLGIFGSLFFFGFGKNEAKMISRNLPVLFSTPTPQPLMGAIAMPSPTPKSTPKASPTPHALIGKMVVVDKNGKPKI